MWRKAMPINKQSKRNVFPSEVAAYKGVQVEMLKNQKL